MKLSKQILLVCAGIAFGAVTANAQNEPQFEGHRGLDFSFDVGPYFGLQKGGGTAFRANLGLGKKFNKNLYFGVSAGFSTNKGNTEWPIMAKLRTYMPSHKTKVLPYIGIGGGYAFTSGDGVPLVELTPGVQIPITPSIDMNAGLSYVAGFVSGQTSHTLGVHVGMDFHRATGVEKKPWAPTRERGLQYVVDVSERGTVGEHAIALNAMAMYKWNHNISFGAGLGYGFGIFPYAYEDYWLESSIDTGYLNLFIRGKYSLSDENKVTPFVSVDLGTHLLSNGHDEGDESDKYEIKDNKAVLFVTPAVGLSFKMAGNSWLDVKAGYEFSSAAVKTGDGFTSKTSAIAVGISFTHTMDILTNGL